MVRDGCVDEAFFEIRNTMDSDADFLRKMEQATVSTRMARHLLRRLEPGKGTSPADVDVEHILPKSVINELLKAGDIKGNNRAWVAALGYDLPETADGKKSLGEKLGQKLNKLGNLALLDNRDNRGARNSSFEKKKSFYEKQGLLLTQALTDFEQWKEDDILERQKALAEKALEAWPK